MRKSELIFVLFLVAAVSILLFESKNYFSLAKQFPQLVGGFTLILLVLDLGIGFWKTARDKRLGKEPEPVPAPSAFQMKRWLILGVCLTAYLILLPLIGFVIATSALMLSMLWFFSIRRPLILVGYTGLTVGIIYGVFVELLYVPLPTGTLW